MNNAKHLPRQLLILSLCILLIAGCAKVNEASDKSARLLALSTPATLSKRLDVVPSLEPFLTISPGQTSQAEVITLLGGPAATDEETLGNSLVWDYRLDQTAALLRIRFDSKTLTVTSVHVYDKRLTVAGLLSQWGRPEVVYQADISEERSGWYNRTFFAYPEKGIFAYVDSPAPQSTNALAELYREYPQSLEKHLERSKAPTEIRIIH